MAKDLFSGQASQYALYRPTYPDELFRYILSFVNAKDAAWDCATGNGQAAAKLAHYFKVVYGTDISTAQLANAQQKENIQYSIAPAERTPFPDNSFDLITVAMAYHWLNWEAFGAEAKRVGKKDSVVAVWAYHTLYTNSEALNDLYLHFYQNIIGPYWDKERRFVDEKYATVNFPFEPLPSSSFQTVLEWSRDQFKGYIETWSSVQKYRKEHQTSPLLLIEEELDSIWPAVETRTVTFPICLLLGRIRK